MNVMAKIQSAFPDDDKWGEGVYFGLPEDRYHALPWIGSSGIKQLAHSPCDWWFNSPMNPMRPADKDTAARVYGRAIHHAILYGIDSFTEKYQTVPNDKGEESVSAEGLKLWIEAEGGMPRKLKADNERMIREEYGVTLLAEPAYNQIMMAAKTITRNPFLQLAFSHGWSEVSIFWKEDGVPCKARIDYLKPKACGDLKSFRAKDRLMSIDAMVIADIKKYLYHVQAAHYSAGRVAAKELVAQGKVFAAAERPDDKWLKDVFGLPNPGFAFVFYKADGAPVAKSYQMGFDGAWMDDGRSYVRAALTNYQAYFEKFGTDVWVNHDEPYDLGQDELLRRGGF